MQCKICGKVSMFEYCLDCQEDDKTLLTVVETLKDKLSHRNKLIAYLRKEHKKRGEEVINLKKALSRAIQAKELI